MDVEKYGNKRFQPDEDEGIELRYPLLVYFAAVVLTGSLQRFQRNVIDIYWQQACCLINCHFNVCQQVAFINLITAGAGVDNVLEDVTGLSA